MVNIITAPASNQIAFNVDELIESIDDPECNSLLNELEQIKVRYDAAMFRKYQGKESALEAKHESLVLERRELAQQINVTQGEQSELSNAATEVDKLVWDAQFNLKVTKENSPQAPFALAADYAAFDKRVQHAEIRLNEARFRQAECKEQVAEWQEKKHELINRLRSLDNEIGDVWFRLQRLRGEPIAPRYDAETGLPV